MRIAADVRPLGPGTTPFAGDWLPRLPPHRSSPRRPPRRPVDLRAGTGLGPGERGRRLRSGRAARDPVPAGAVPHLRRRDRGRLRVPEEPRPGRPPRQRRVAARARSCRWRFSFDPDPRFQAFLNVAVSREFVWKIEADRSKPSEDVALELKEAFVWLRSLPGGLLPPARAPAVRGRAPVALRRGARRGPASVPRAGPWRSSSRLSRMASSAKDLLQLDPAAGADQQLRAATRATGSPRGLDAGGVRDRSRRPGGARAARPSSLGLRSRGEPIEDLDYWLELGYVGGPGRLDADPRVGRRPRRHLRVPGRPEARADARLRLRQRRREPGRRHRPELPADRAAGQRVATSAGPPTSSTTGRSWTRS